MLISLTVLYRSLTLHPYTFCTSVRTSGWSLGWEKSCSTVQPRASLDRPGECSQPKVPDVRPAVRSAQRGNPVQAIESPPTLVRAEIPEGTVRREPQTLTTMAFSAALPAPRNKDSVCRDKLCVRVRRCNLHILQSGPLLWFSAK